MYPRAAQAGVLLVSLAGCASPAPSAQVGNRISLPVPTSAGASASADRLSTEDQGERYEISARTLIPLAFERQPDIESSFERFKSEEARYDFFYTARDSLTPRLRVASDFYEERTPETVARQRDHAVEVSLEKHFFDTTKMNVGVGYRTNDDNVDIGSQPFLSADVRYPLWASREKLERTSEDIFRRNELDDAQLAYIQEIRSRLQHAMFKFYDVVYNQRLVEIHQQWLDDLRALADRIETVDGQGNSADRQRLEAEIARVNADLRKTTGWYEIQLARLKAACGLPFHAHVQLLDEDFNPFEGTPHEDLLTASIDTDPEIQTLRNAVRNAEVQLDLARRGRWDIALRASGDAGLEGRGAAEGLSDWSLSVGLDVSAVDPRVTDSLIRQAQASITRFKQAIVARENNIFVDTLEPLVRIDTLGASRQELIDNLPRYVTNYAAGVEAYLAGTLNIDDLLDRREEIFERQDEVSGLTYLVGANVAELCSATGKFFELLNGPRGDARSGAAP